MMLIVSVAAFGQGRNVSKTASNAAVFLEIPVGAAAIAMGSAFVSVANDATSLYWNPAGSALLPKSEFIASHAGWIADTKFDYGAFVLPLSEFGVLGFSFTSLSMADMQVRTVEQPEGTGEFFSAGDMAAGLSYSRLLSDRFSLGVTAKYVRESIWHETSEGFALDIGTSFRTDLFGGMNIGATLSNFGTKMQLSGRDTRTFIRLDPSKQGSNDRISSDLELESWDLPLLFQIGVSTAVMKTENYRWTIAADALHPSDNDESMNVGTEFAFQDFLFLRGGYQSLFLDQHEGGMSFGLGVASSSLINAVGIKFDYAFRDMGRLSSVHTFSIRAQF